MKSITVLIFTFVLFSKNISFAWNDSTHVLVAMIARQNLNHGVMDKIMDIAEDIDGEFPCHFDFEESACWAADISRCGMKALDAWHEKATPYDPLMILTEEQKNKIVSTLEKNSVSFALSEAVRTLKDPKAGAWGKNFMLRILLHCIGDIHHPLRCVNLYNDYFPYGDNGGQIFKISGRSEKSLREFWDNIAGNYMNSYGCNHDQTYMERIEMELMLEKILLDFPLINFTQIRGKTFDEIAEESYQLAIRFAYQNIYPNGNLSQEYVVLCRQIAYSQIALAGYRLADILNEIFDN